MVIQEKIIKKETEIKGVNPDILSASHTIKKWLEIIKIIKEKENKNIKEGTKYIIRYNSIKISEDLFNKLREI